MDYSSKLRVFGIGMWRMVLVGIIKIMYTSTP